MPKPKPNPTRERRIADEIVVDAYNEEERAMSWYCYLEEQLAFPFKARCIGPRTISPLKKSLEARNRGRIDHVLVYAPMGFREIAQPALRRLRKTWAKGIDDIAVTLLGIGSRESFLEVGGNAIPELASSATWVSQTPFIPPRFLKADGKDSLEGQVRAELRRRGLPDLATAPMVALPSGEDAAGRRARRFRHFARTRREGAIPGPPPGQFHLTLTFQSPLAGPLCLGWGCHFGLGSFAPGGC